MEKDYNIDPFKSLCGTSKHHVSLTDTRQDNSSELQTVPRKDNEMQPPSTNKPPQTPPTTSSDEDDTETDSESDNEPPDPPISDNETPDHHRLPPPPDFTNRQDSGYGDSLKSSVSHIPPLQQGTRSPTPPTWLDLYSPPPKQLDQSPIQETNSGGKPDELVSPQLTPAKPNNGQLHLTSETTPQREVHEHVIDNNRDGRILSTNTHRLYITGRF